MFDENIDFFLDFLKSDSDNLILDVNHYRKNTNIHHKDHRNIAPLSVSSLSSPSPRSLTLRNKPFGMIRMKTITFILTLLHQEPGVTSFLAEKVTMFFIFFYFHS